MLLALTLFAVVLAAVALPVIELGMRWWIRRRNVYYVFPPRWRMRLHLDRDTFPGFPPVTGFEVNSDGERGNEVPRPAEGLYRVLVAGGSQPEGAFLDQPSAWPAMVERLIATPEHLRSLGAS